MAFSEKFMLRSKSSKERATPGKLELNPIIKAALWTLVRSRYYFGYSPKGGEINSDPKQIHRKTIFQKRCGRRIQGRIYENSSKISAGGVPNLLKFGWLSLVDCSSARIKASHLSLPFLPGEWVILQLQCGVCKVNWLNWQLSLDFFHLEMQISLHCAYKPCTVSKHWGWKIALC